MRRNNGIDMIIRFKKNPSTKPHALSCSRSDGSTTWTRLRLPVQHDLIHYAVEKIERIRLAMCTILYEWQTVTPGQTFELTFDERQPQMSTHARS